MTAAQRESGFRSIHDPPSPRYTGVSGDRTMQFKLYWKHRGDAELKVESYEQVTTDPEKWSRDIVDWFNSTLRPRERKRIFVKCEVIGEVPPAEHRWFKKTAMTKTVVGGLRHGQMYDAMECGRCGVTGKRYGLSGSVKLDSKWRKIVFQRCDTSMKERGLTPS